MNKIAIIYTTFLRDKLMYKTVQAAFEHWNDDYMLLIADQGHMTEEKDRFLSEIIRRYDKEAIRTIDISTERLVIKGKRFCYYQLDFDCGLSVARNSLVQEAAAMNIEYCFLLADSLKINARYDFTTLIEFMTITTDRGIIGLDDIGRPSWERNLDLVPGKYFYLSRNKETPLDYKGTKFQRVDICRNFFFAKTECLLQNPWDNNLKMCEHEDFFWRLKKETSWKVYYSNSIQCEYVEEKPTEYLQYRNRMYREFANALRAKYNIQGWVKYEK